jgi:hypothetical protein
MRMMIGEYGRRALIVQSVQWQLVGLALMVSHVLLVKVSLLFFPIVVFLIGWLYARASFAGILVFLQVLLYQNVIISCFDENMEPTTFSALQGTNFVVLSIFAAIASLRLLPQRGRYQAVFVSIVVALSFAAVYTVFGMASAGATPAMIYFRSFTGTTFAAIVGLDLGRVWSFRTIGLCLIYSSVIALVLSAVEYFLPVDYYRTINAVRFLQLKYWNATKDNTFYTPEDIIRQFTSVFFNISGSEHGEYGFDNFRFGGTAMNPISNAYILGVLAIVAIALKRSRWLLLLLPMIALAGAKGAVTLLLISLLLYWLWIIVHDRRLLLVGGLCVSACYVGFGIYLGLQNGDFHVLGFLGGVHSLIHTPIGHGIGVGGNLSVKAANTRLDTEAAFRNVDFALESAVGVLMYQMGIAAAAVLGVFVTFLYKAPLGLSETLALPRRTDIIFFALATIAINGVFQEEAYAPYASGLIMLLAAVLMANQRRMAEVLVPGRRRGRLLLGSGTVACVTLCLWLLAGAQAWATPPADRLETLRRGVNISTLFEQGTDLDGEIRQIAATGLFHVRVFVLAEALGDPGYMQRIDRLAAEATGRHVGLILCMASKTHEWTDNANVKDVWAAAWTVLAERLRTSSPRYIFPELANEPGLTDSVKWDRVQNELYRTVRARLPDHTILLTGSPTSTVWSLVDHPINADRESNVAYVFHLYQPMAVTCQGCACCPQYQPLRGLSYPPDVSNIRHMMNPAVADILEAYRRDGATLLQREVELAAAWSVAHDVPVLATEFGVFSAASEGTRAAWLREARSRLEQAHIGWTLWEWKGGFGVAPLLPHAPLTDALGLHS